MSKSVRTITVRIDGDATKANKAFGSVGKSAGALSKKMGAVGSAIVAAFSIDKIIQFGKESVQAMMADQKSAALLAKTLENVTGARKSDIDAVEAYIRKTEEALGVQDDELRPAYAKLVRVTKDTTKAQKFLNLALDVSAGTGKDLGSVATALSRALTGNFTALTRLGVPIDKATIKSKDLNKIIKILSDTYGGSATTRAKTFAFQMERLKIAFENIKEDVGYALLPALQDLAEWMNGEGIKALRTFFTVLMGGGSETPGRDKTARVADSWKAKVDPLQGSAQSFAEAIRGLTESVGNLFKQFDKGTGSGSGLVGFINLLTTAVKLMDGLVKAIGYITNGKAKGIFSNKFLQWLNDPLGADKKFRKAAGMKPRGEATGGTIVPGSTYLVGEKGPELFRSTSAGTITPNYQLAGGAGGAVNVTVNVHGSVIRERDLATSVRDQIAQLMRRRGLDPSILGV